MRPAAIIKSTEVGHTYLRMMLYGEPGVGKSTFIGTGSKTLVLVNNPGESTSITTSGKEVDIWPVDNYDDIDDAFDYLRQEGHKIYDWVWVDNLTLFQDQCMDQIMRDLVAKKPDRNQFVPDQHEYLVNQNRLGNVVRAFMKLPMNVGFTAHAMRSEDDDGRITYLPMLQGGQGALSQKICGYMNVVAFMSASIKEGKRHRKIIISKSGKYLAKSRFANSPDVIDNPTVPLLLSAIGAKVAPAQKRTTVKTTRTTRSNS